MKSKCRRRRWLPSQSTMLQRNSARRNMKVDPATDVQTGSREQTLILTYDWALFPQDHSSKGSLPAPVSGTHCPCFGVLSFCSPWRGGDCAFTESCRQGPEAEHGGCSMRTTSMSGVFWRVRDDSDFAFILRAPLQCRGARNPEGLLGSVALVALRALFSICKPRVWERGRAWACCLQLAAASVSSAISCN